MHEADINEFPYTEAAALKAQVMSQVLYDDSFQSVTAPELLYAFSGNDRLLVLPKDAVVGREVWEVAVTSGAAKSERKCAWLGW